MASTATGSTAVIKDANNKISSNSKLCDCGTTLPRSEILFVCNIDPNAPISVTMNKRPPTRIKLARVPIIAITKMVGRL